MPRASVGFTPYKKHPAQKEQSELAKVCTYLRRHYPDVMFLTDFAAGLNLTDNERQRMMSQRSHDGMPDLIILEPKDGYHGMLIEFKKPGTSIYKKDGKTLRKQPYSRVYKKNGRNFYKRGDHLEDQALCLKHGQRKKYYSCWGIGYERTTQLIDKYMGVQDFGLVF